jgi:hypothetical protein
MDLRPSGRPRPHLAAFVVAALLALALTASASAAPVRGTAMGASLRIGHAPIIPTGSAARGTLPQSSVIDATVALAPSDPAALSAYARAVSTPGSPVYHHFLSVAQFARRFAPGAAQVASVRAALQAQGLTAGPLAANGLSFDVTATAGRMATAFSTSFERYRTPNGRSVFANTTAPALPDSVSGLVQGVIGLDSLAVPTPAGLVRSPRARAHARPGTARDATAPGEGQACGPASASGGYTAAQIASAYGLTDLYAQGDGGSGSTVAVFELEPYLPSDIANYQSCYGTNTPVTNIQVDGGPGTGAGQGEAALDIEDLIGLAPNSSILVYSGKNSGTGAMDTYRTIITQDRAKVISTSWGLCELQEGSVAATAESTLFQEAAVQGQTIFAASGDHGVKDCISGTHSTTIGVDDPASQPYVTGVGGTSLSNPGPPPAESVWNSNWNTSGGAQSGAGGGGVSVFWVLPSWQAGVVGAQSRVICSGNTTSCRQVPDVSADADILTGYSIYYSGHWSIFGGTSAAAPTWGALAALANSSAACTGRTVGFANPALYQAARTDYATYFNDVTTGNNTFGGITGYNAGSGYDMATGLGSPKGGPIAAALCGSTWTPPAASQPPAPTPTPAASPTVTLTHPASQTARVGDAVHLQVHATDSAGQTLTWRATGLPSGLSIAASTGLISGTPKRAGKSNSTITVTDTSGVSAQGTVAWSVAGRPTITGGLRITRGRPFLSLKVGAGSNAPPLQSIVIAPSGQIRFARRSRDLSRGITVRNSSGRKLKSVARLRHGDLVVTLRTASVRKASLRITAPAISLIKIKARPGKHRRPAALHSLTITVTDATAYRTAVVLR